MVYRMDKTNIMRNLKIEKVTANIGVGDAGDNLEKARRLLQKITGKTPILTNARARVQVFGIRKGDTIGVKVTMRGSSAEDFLKRAFETIDSKISRRSFDKFGNFSFGIKEYIDFPGVRYDPSIGLVGFDVCVTINRPGGRIALRKRKRSDFPIKQRGTREESMAFISKKFGVTILEN